MISFSTRTTQAFFQIYHLHPRLHTSPGLETSSEASDLAGSSSVRLPSDPRLKLAKGFAGKSFLNGCLFYSSALSLEEHMTLKSLKGVSLQEIGLMWSSQ
jgi:hypothetical protein